MSPREFESLVADSVASRLGLEPDRFALRREPSGPVDAVAYISAAAAGNRVTRDMPCVGFDSLRVSGSRITVRLNAEMLEQLAHGVEAALAAAAYGGRRMDHRNVLIDFCDPNANKPLHLGHLRNLSIGAGLQRLFASAGAQVTTQLVLGDIGRNVAEAMAGMELFGAQISRGRKADEWIGSCYARYVTEHDIPAGDSASPDAPIARELRSRNDLADELLMAWLNGHQAVHDRWQSLVEQVTTAQRDTLSRLGVTFDRTLSESDGAQQAPGWLETALRSGACVKRGDGAIVYETGRESYPVLLLARPDGVPTEHLRALPLWSRLQEEGERWSRCIHVMGAEWLVTTELREELIRRLMPARLFDRYEKLAHGFVTVGGSKMKSSDGLAVGIDEALNVLGSQPELTQLLERCEGVWQRDGLAAALLSATLLNVPLNESCEIDPDTFCTARAHHFGLTVLRASLAMTAREGVDRFSADVSVDRYLVLQAARLPGFLDRAADSGDLSELLRFVHRVAQQVLEVPPRSRSAAAAASWVLAHGLRVLGLAPLAAAATTSRSPAHAVP